VSIPKKAGGERVLGIPTVSDRIAQMVIKQVLEPELEPHFLPDSYGYRPGKSALDAVGITRRRCWKYNWVLEFDIRGLFDNIPHDLLMKAVEHHTSNSWVVLYIKRWLVAPMQAPDGKLHERTKGTPQGGVISPLLANLFLHYVFDTWMQRNHPALAWCRYADDGLVHCRTEREARKLMSELEQRFSECGLELHPEKTKIVYCKDGNRRGGFKETSFDFLGFTFRPRPARNEKEDRLFVSFSPAVSKSAAKGMRARIRRSRLRNRTELDIADIAEFWNPILRGWYRYYGKYGAAVFYTKVLRHFHDTLLAWAAKKHKRLRGRKKRTGEFLQGIYERQPELFLASEIGRKIVFA
jgi:RNA-directed DNA polymerase